MTKHNYNVSEIKKLSKVYTCKQAAEILGIPRTTLRDFSKTRGITFKKGKTRYNTIKRLLKKGKSSDKIAKALGMSPNYFYSYCKQHDISLLKYDYSKILTLDTEQLTYKEIAEIVDIPYSAAQYFCKKDNLKVKEFEFGKIDDELFEKIHNLLKQGKSVNHIHSLLKVNSAKIKKVIKKTDFNYFEQNNKRIVDIDELSEQIKELAKEGKTRMEISSQLNVNYGYICCFARRYKIQIKEERKKIKKRNSKTYIKTKFHFSKLENKLVNYFSHYKEINERSSILFEFINLCTYYNCFIDKLILLMKENNIKNIEQIMNIKNPYRGLFLEVKKDYIGRGFYEKLEDLKIEMIEKDIIKY